MINDLTKGAPLKLMLLFSIPLLIGNIFQQFYNIADIIIVGRTLGMTALASVGAVSPLFFLIMFIIVGITNGFAVITGQRFGAKDYEGVRRSVTMSTILSTAFTITFTIICAAAMHHILFLMNVPQEIYKDAYYYIQIVVIGLIVANFYNLLASIIRALGDSMTPLYCLIIASVLNIFLALLFILEFHMGVPGSAFALVLSQAFSALLCVWYVKKHFPILHLKKKDWDIASDLYDKASEENPDKSKAWYGLYRALTGDFEAVDRYALFVCDGNYFDDDDKEMGSQSFFYGNGFISRALDCPDADKTGIIDNVTAFIKKCAEHGKKDIEDSIKELLEGFESMRKDLDSQRDIVKKEKKKDKTKAFIPAVIVLALLAVCVWYFFASGDWLGKVLGVAGGVLVLKFGGKFIGRSFSNAKAEGVEWDNVAEQKFAPIIEDMESQVQAVMRYCIDLDNYNIVLDNLKNKDKFMEGYLKGEFDGMKDYDQISDNSEKFIFDLLDGKIERYNYLLDAVK